MSPETWRLLREAPADGAANMARDEALLDSAARGGPPTLRLYGWIRPTLSLGAHQDAREVDLAACRRLAVDVVRRPTGGGAVLHQHEMTYSVTGRTGSGPFPRSVVDLYGGISRALIGGLARLGVQVHAVPRSPGGRAPADCFSRSSSGELLAGGRKVVGSAQVRRRRAFLQHGSILVRLDRTLRGAVLGAAAARAGEGAIDETEAGPIGLSGLLGRDIPEEEIAAALQGGFEETFGASLALGALEAEESERAARLRSFKYLDRSWTLEGKRRALPID